MTPKNTNRFNISPHVSSLVDSFVPEYIREEFPDFIKFIEAYLNFLEEAHGSTYYENTLSRQRDIEFQEEDFLKQIESEIGLYVPREYESTPRVFYNRITDIWRSKGSKEAIELFFRLFLNDPVEIKFPWDRVLKPSDGVWNKDVKLRVSMISGSGFDLVGKKIFQIENFATSVVEKIERRLFSDGAIFELTLSKEDTIGEFVSGNTIRIEGSDLSAEVYRSCSRVVATDRGQSYRVGEKITLKNYDGYSFIAFVSSVDSLGGITDITISNFGAGNTPQHVINDPENSNQFYFQDFLVFDRNTNTRVESVEPEFEVNTINGFGAKFSLEFSPIVETAGRYAGVKGQLSESIVLQDSKRFQKYSYEVVGNYPYNRWIEPLKRTVHQAGTEVFSNINLSNSISFVTQSEFYSQKFEPANYTLGENAAVSMSVLGFVQRYAFAPDNYFREDYTGEIAFNYDEQSETTPQLENQQRSFQSGL
jgi:hypothetical protein